MSSNNNVFPFHYYPEDNELVVTYVLYHIIKLNSIILGRKGIGLIFNRKSDCIFRMTLDNG